MSAFRFFHQSVFGLMKCGRAIQPIQVKSGFYTQKERLFTGLLTQITGCTLMRIAAIFSFVLIRRNEIW